MINSDQSLHRVPPVRNLKNQYLPIIIVVWSFTQSNATLDVLFFRHLQLVSFFLGLEVVITDFIKLIACQIL